MCVLFAGSHKGIEALTQLSKKIPMPEADLSAYTNLGKNLCRVRINNNIHANNMVRVLCSNQGHVYDDNNNYK